ncbi:amino acid permease [Oenococcus oeni]|uniref:amino acid permease n=1 Tax=Oenococcus oeni TaxID=1247 RepID=UPI0008F8A879|nr:amino acid permease [Oenococcus oeni]OIM62317.1 amino acid transporter [Oenococcus oeni]SYW05985.1 Amino-acid permease AapA [Oenococcus oeni]SYW09386.1 Amino-acid permease AapA [Oenococcus oeni]
MKKLNDSKNNMKRELSNRHIQLISIGGTIGTGLFLGASRSIAFTGPSIMLVYLAAGIFMFLLTRAMGEMLYMDPDQHTFINFISKYLGKPFGFFSGWTYWLSIIFTGMGELTAVGIYFQFWFPKMPMWIIQLMFLAAIMSINLITVKFFGEAEFWFAMIKISAIVALILTSIFMLATDFKTPIGAVGLTNISKNFQLFPNGFKNFVMAFPMVFFAYQGIEFVGITTSETKNPRAVLPKAINQIIIRILIFYIGSLIAIMLIYPWQSLDPKQSPFVWIFKLLGISWAAGLINFVVLTAASSTLNSILYSSGRHLYQLASDSSGKFNKNCAVISKNGVPARTICLSALAVAVSPIINSIPTIKDAFSVIASVSSGAYLLIYILTLFAHRKYTQSKDYLANGFLMPKPKFFGPLTIAFMVFILISMLFQKETCPGVVTALIWLVVFGGYSLAKYKNENS